MDANASAGTPDVPLAAACSSMHQSPTDVPTTCRVIICQSLVCLGADAWATTGATRASPPARPIIRIWCFILFLLRQDVDGTSTEQGNHFRQQHGSIEERCRAACRVAL